MSTENTLSSFNSVFLTRGILTDSKIQQLAGWGKRLIDMGAVKGTEGNLSYRSSLGFIITGTNVALSAITGETVAEITGVVYGLSKHSVYVKGMVNPSRETLLHTQIYELKEDANAIFHAHDIEVMKQAVKLGIPSTELEQPAGSPELAQEAVKLLKLEKDVKYFVLKNHGVVALGTSMDEAGKLLEEMRARLKKRK